MKISNHNTLTINLDEAKHLASEPQSWNQDTLKDKKIALAKAAIELMQVLKRENVSIAWDGEGEF